MNIGINNEFLNEQVICINCGFCCDGTLFLRARLEPGEKGNLPEKIEENYFIKDDKEYFRLPCLYFSDKCTIYNKKKAIICSAYRCQLLEDHKNKKITSKEALEIVKKTKELRGEIFFQYASVVGGNNKMHFKKLVMELWDKKTFLSEQGKINTDYEKLMAQCNIFESLLTKHFRSAKDFDNMLIDNSE